MDEQLQELKALVEQHQAAPPGAPGAFNFVVLLPILKLMLPLLVKDASMLAIIQKILDIVAPLFPTQTAGAGSPE